ncbi:Pyruvate decarboxylase 2, partial [Tilletia horrida]
PLDAGIISVFKRKYSALLSRHWVAKLDQLLAARLTAEKPSDKEIKLVKLVNLQMVFVWVHEAWNSISQESIVHCWAHTGIIPDEWKGTEDNDVVL